MDPVTRLYKQRRRWEIAMMKLSYTIIAGYILSKEITSVNCRCLYSYLVLLLLLLLVQFYFDLRIHLLLSKIHSLKHYFTYYLLLNCLSMGAPSDVSV